MILKQIDFRKLATGEFITPPRGMHHWSGIFARIYTFGIIPLVIFSGCIPSLVYDPAVHLPSSPLRGGGLQVYGSWCQLPETRPRQVQNDMSPGADIGMRLGITDRLSLDASTWSASDDLNGQPRGGVAAGAVIVLSRDSALSCGVLVRGGLAYAGNQFEGGGASASAVLWIPERDWLRSYLAAGPVVGIRNLTSDASTPAEWGWGIIWNLGVNLCPVSWCSLNGELSACYQEDRYDLLRSAVMVPSLGLSINF